MTAATVTTPHGLRPGQRTLVVGAGVAGRALARDLRAAGELGLMPVGFLDDAPADEVDSSDGIHVLGTLADLPAVVAHYRVQVVVLAIPGLPSVEVRRLGLMAARLGVPVRYLPSLTALLQRDIVGTDLRDLDIGALIGRRERRVVSPECADILTGRRVLITGAGGSIGSELCRQVHAFAPSTLVMLDHDESNLHRLQLELWGEAFLDASDVVVADIRDESRMDQVMAEHAPEVVFHAAALKHLPMLERHPAEGVKSNVGGTRNVVRSAVRHGVDRLVLISTDKAADPTSVLGATKLLAEWVAKDARTPNTTVACVRFGNVLGSRGSLLAVLAEQLRTGHPVTVTHPDVTRFFMTIEEAVGLVIESAHLAHGGETFVLDMGEPVRIVDLVESFAASRGLASPEIEFTGLRPGEKLHESLFAADETCVPTEHSRIFGTAGMPTPPNFADAVEDLLALASRGTGVEVVGALSRLVGNYRAPAAVPALAGSRAPYPDDY